MQFALSRPSGVVTAGDPLRCFDSASDAADAIAAARVDDSPIAVVGALSFEPDAPDALVAPRRLDVGTPHVWDVSVAPLGPVRLVAARPSADEHVRRVRATIARIGADEARKVVLARAIELQSDEDVDVYGLYRSLAAKSPERNAFAVDLSAAGSAFDGRALIGSSPESLVRKAGARVTCRPFAGSAPRDPDPMRDAHNAESLLASRKDQCEHRFVVDHLAARLGPLVRDLSIPTEPELSSTGEMWHLATPVEATLRDPTMTSLDLARVLHPTPAVGGVPTDAAAQVIADLEGPRGFYAGAVGWCNADGDGEWMVSIRCAEIDADHRTMRAWSGGGIVADSDPDAELAETTAKFATILRALGVPDLLEAE